MGSPHGSKSARESPMLIPQDMLIPCRIRRARVLRVAGAGGNWPTAESKCPTLVCGLPAPFSKCRMSNVQTRSERLHDLACNDALQDCATVVEFATRCGKAAKIRAVGPEFERSTPAWVERPQTLVEPAIPNSGPNPLQSDRANTEVGRATPEFGQARPPIKTAVSFRIGDCPRSASCC